VILVPYIVLSFRAGVVLLFLPLGLALGYYCTATLTRKSITLDTNALSVLAFLPLLPFAFHLGLVSISVLVIFLYSPPLSSVYMNPHLDNTTS